MFNKFPSAFQVTLDLDTYKMAYVNSKLLISPPVFLGWGLCRGEETFPVHFGGTLRAPCSELPQSQDTPALGHKPIWLQGCDTSPGHYGLRVRIIFSFFLLLSYHLNWNIQVNYNLVGIFVFFLSKLSQLVHFHIDVHMFFGGVLFPIDYYRMLCMFPCVTYWVWWLFK